MLEHAHFVPQILLMCLPQKPKIRPEIDMRRGNDGSHFHFSSSSYFISLSNNLICDIPPTERQKCLLRHGVYFGMIFLQWSISKQDHVHHSWIRIQSLDTWSKVSISSFEIQRFQVANFATLFYNLANLFQYHQSSI